MRKLKVVNYLALALLVFALAGCSSAEVPTAASPVMPSPLLVTGVTAPTSADTDFAAIFDGAKQIDFEFSSGAGGWMTGLTLLPDGSFSGLYLDSDAGSQYQSIFAGRFEIVSHDAANVYTLKRVELTTQDPVGTTGIVDGIPTEFADPYGVAEGELFTIYMPGTEVSELSDEVISWLHLSGETQLPAWALVNNSTETAFISWTPTWGEPLENPVVSETPTNSLSSLSISELNELCAANPLSEEVAEQEQLTGGICCSVGWVTAEQAAEADRTSPGQPWCWD